MEIEISRKKRQVGRKDKGKKKTANSFSLECILIEFPTNTTFSTGLHIHSGKWLVSRQNLWQSTTQTSSHHADLPETIPPS